MKLSLKLQDDNQNQNPLLKAKLPITIFNQPFTSSLTTTTTTPKDLSFCLSTNFSSGPSLKLCYTPSTTTTTTPFSFSLKSGLGLFGSPHNSPLIFSANFSLSSINPSTVIPTFSLHFKPQFGHFSLHRSTSSNPNPEPVSGSHSISGTHFESGSLSNSEFATGFAPDEPLSGWQELKLEPCNGNENGIQNPNPSHFNGVHSNNGLGFVPESPLVLKSKKKDGFFTGVAIKARTVLPVTKRVMVNLRWGLNFEADSGTKMPYLTVNKIGIERVEEVNEVKEVKKESNMGDMELLKGMCFWMRRDLEVLEKENREMMQCLEEMKLGVAARNSHRESDGVGKKVLPALGERSSEFERWGSKKNGEEGNGQRELKKSVKPVSDVEAELQRAIKAASS